MPSFLHTITSAAIKHLAVVAAGATSEPDLSLSSLHLWPAYAWTWAAVGLVFLCFKIVVLSSAEPQRITSLGWLLPGFIFLWPGMELEPFYRRAKARAWQQANKEADPLIGRYLLSGLANILAAVALFILLQRGMFRQWVYLYALLGLSSLALALLFGAFDLLAAFWRWNGVDVQKQWHFLPASESLSDYWSRRWNRAFHDFARNHVYLPFKRHWNSTAALFITFLFSGLIHDLIISVPARGGYGLPTGYFLLQALGMWVERRWIPAGFGRRLWAWLVVVSPIGLLIHRPFVEYVVLPQLSFLLP